MELSRQFHDLSKKCQHEPPGGKGFLAVLTRKLGTQSFAHLFRLSIIRIPVRGGVLVDPVLFGVGYALSPWHLALGPGPIKGTAFRSVAEGLETGPFPGRVPVVNDHLYRHPAGPDAGQAFGLVSPGIQSPVPALPRCRYVVRSGGPLAEYSPRLFSFCIESGCFEPRIRNRHRQPAHDHPNVKLVLPVSRFSHGYLEFTAFIPACSVNAKHVPLVAVVPLIERPHETDSRLNGLDPSAPGDFLWIGIPCTINLYPVCTGPGGCAGSVRRPT